MASPSPPATMRCWLYSKFGGGADALELIKDKPVPAVTPGHVLVKVQAASLNPLDWKFQEGSMRPMFPPTIPFVSGYDAAGEVVAVGEVKGGAATTFKVGDKVFGASAFPYGGCFAEYVLLPIETVALLPPGVSPSQSLALVTTGMTALQSLRDAGGLVLPKDGATDITPGPPKNVMVANASGGVGLIAVQLAKAIGCHVTATCGARNAELVKSLGADEVLDYKTPEGKALTSPSGKKYDVLIDGTLILTPKIVKPVMAHGGKWVLFSPSLKVLPSVIAGNFPFLQNFKTLFFFMKGDGKDSTTLSKLLADGVIKVFVDSETPFSQLPEAWKKCQEGHSSGKIVVLMD